MGTPSGSPLWLSKTRALRRHLRRYPASFQTISRRYAAPFALDAIAWLELHKLAKCDSKNRWCLTTLGIESLDWIAVPDHAQPPEAQFHIGALVDRLSERHDARKEDILGQGTVGRCIPARDELFWELRKRGLSVSQIAVRMGFEAERVANAIGRHSLRVMRAYA